MILFAGHILLAVYYAINDVIVDVTIIQKINGLQRTKKNKYDENEYEEQEPENKSTNMKKSKKNRNNKNTKKNAKKNNNNKSTKICCSCGDSNVDDNK